MSERLSRLERYSNTATTRETRQSSRVAKYSSGEEGLLTGSRIRLPAGRKKNAAHTVRRAVNEQGVLTRSRTGEVSETDEEENEKDKDYVPRSTIYPSRKIKIAKFFYGYLIFLFVALTIMLLWWGIKLSGFMPNWYWLQNLASRSGL